MIMAMAVINLCVHVLVFMFTNMLYVSLQKEMYTEFLKQSLTDADFYE